MVKSITNSLNPVRSRGPHDHQTYAMCSGGENVAVAVGVGESVGVADGVGESVGVVDGVGENVGVADGVGESVGVADGVGENVAVAVGVGESVGVADGMGENVAVAVGVVVRTRLVRCGRECGSRGRVRASNYEPQSRKYEKNLGMVRVTHKY